MLNKTEPDNLIQKIRKYEYEFSSALHKLGKSPTFIDTVVYLHNKFEEKKNKKTSSFKLTAAYNKLARVVKRSFNVDMETYEKIEPLSLSSIERIYPAKLRKALEHIWKKTKAFDAISKLEIPDAGVDMNEETKETRFPNA